jgi:hypothetical protein
VSAPSHFNNPDDRHPRLREQLRHGLKCASVLTEARRSYRPHGSSMNNGQIIAESARIKDQFFVNAGNGKILGSEERENIVNLNF